MMGLFITFIKRVGVITWDRVVIDKEPMVPSVSQARHMFGPFCGCLMPLFVSPPIIVKE